MKRRDQNLGPTDTPGQDTRLRSKDDKKREEKKTYIQDDPGSIRLHLDITNEMSFEDIVDASAATQRAFGVVIQKLPLAHAKVPATLACTH